MIVLKLTILQLFEQHNAASLDYSVDLLEESFDTRGTRQDTTTSPYKNKSKGMDTSLTSTYSPFQSFSSLRGAYSLAICASASLSLTTPRQLGKPQ